VFVSVAVAVNAQYAVTLYIRSPADTAGTLHVNTILPLNYETDDKCKKNGKLGMI
jgi:hypothetical protein